MSYMKREYERQHPEEFSGMALKCSICGKENLEGCDEPEDCNRKAKEIEDKKSCKYCEGGHLVFVGIMWRLCVCQGGKPISESDIRVTNKRCKRPLDHLPLR